MKILSKKNVFDAALDRIRYLFDEFPVVVVSTSGGKDSTVVFELTMRVARERGRLPLTVFWLDQEAEWTATEDYVRELMYRPDVKPMWLQMPMHMDNAASFDTKFLKCWDPEKESEWVHQKDPVSIKENRYGTDRFKKLFPAIWAKEYAGQKVATVTGVRCEESPARYMGLTQEANYKWITWGARYPKGEHYTFCPIYDWSYTDVWHAIHSEKWSYNRIYDYQYRYGLPVKDMRVSNLHHETAVRSLFYLQEMEPELYERLAKRLPGVDTAGKMGKDNFYAGKLPFMFANWSEYRDYLIEKLVANDPDWQQKLRDFSAKMQALLAGDPDNLDRAAKTVVQSIICNDYTGTKLENFQTAFVGFYKRDRRDSLTWTADTFQRELDPISFQWYENRLRESKLVVDGQKVFDFQRFRYWVIGDTLHRLEVVPACQGRIDAGSDARSARSGHSVSVLPLCETTRTPRRACALDCGTYPGNLGPCETWECGGNGRCVYCDHGEGCHAGAMPADPVSHVRWVPIDKVVANDYNPNSVAKNEMRLLYLSIQHDGYTQPIVTIYDADQDKYIIVDGFHRHLVGRTYKDIAERTGNRLPVVVIKKDINDRMASTVRHNRARGKHSVDGMASMVFTMLENGWADDAICNELGLEAEELVRLKHITGFSKLFENVEYKKSWETVAQVRLRKTHEQASHQAS